MTNKVQSGHVDGVIGAAEGVETRARKRRCPAPAPEAKRACSTPADADLSAEAAVESCSDADKSATAVRVLIEVVEDLARSAASDRPAEPPEADEICKAIVPVDSDHEASSEHMECPEQSAAYYQYLQAVYAYYAQFGYMPVISDSSSCASSSKVSAESGWEAEMIYPHFLPVNERDVKVTEWRKGTAREGPMQRKSFLRDSKYFREESKDVFRKWLVNHIHYPYPTRSEKLALCEESGLTLKQVDNWFTNTRKRHWKRIIKDWEDQHLEAALPAQALQALTYEPRPHTCIRREELS